MKFSGTQALLRLLESDNPEIREKILHIILMILNCARINAHESAPRGNKTGSMCDFIGIPFSLFTSYLHNMTEVLLKNPITKEIYEVILRNFLSGKAIDHQNKTNSIQFNMLLDVLFKVCGKSPLDILLRFMSDLKELITVDSEAANNRKAIFTIFGWQKQFLDFFHMLYERRSEFEATGKIVINQVALLICELMNFIHLDCLHRENLSPEVRLNAFEESMLLLSHLPLEECSLLYINTIWGLMQRLFLEEMNREQSKPCEKPLHILTFEKLYLLIEEYIEAPPQLVPKYDENSRWKLSDQLYKLITKSSPYILQSYEAKNRPVVEDKIMCLELRVCLSLVKETGTWITPDRLDTKGVPFASEAIKRFMSTTSHYAATLPKNQGLMYLLISEVNNIIVQSKLSPNDPWLKTMTELRTQLTENHKNTLQDVIQDANKAMPKGFFKKPSEEDIKRSRTIIENCMKMYMMTSTNIQYTEWFHCMQILLQTLNINAESIITLQLPEIIISRRLNQFKEIQSDVYSKIENYNVNDSLNAIIQYEWNRIISNIQACIRAKQHNLYNWEKILRTLTHERGPWGNAIDKKTPVYWKLQNKLNEFNTRHKLKINIHGTNHELSSIFTDTEGDNSIKRSRAQSQIEMDNQLLKDIIVASTKKAKNNQNNNLNRNRTSSINNEPQLIHHLINQYEVELITPLLPVKGILQLTKDKLIFTRDSIYDTELYSGIPIQGKKGVKKESLLKAPHNIQVPLSMITSIENRRYQLRQVAFEIFTIGHRTLFFNMKNKSSRDEVTNIIGNSHLPNMSPFTGNLSTQEVLGRTGICQKWCKREISNFEYLMELNRLAGRSYNDLAQYPVMPWILKDYKSENLDLNDPEIYRDFTKPMGAQLPERREEISEKYQLMKEEYQRMKSSSEDDDLGIMCPPPRHYAVHYSNPASVLWYFIRLEPFTTGHIYLQDGVFDKTDRQFFSVEEAYVSATTNDTDVKELTPEWFLLPEFLENKNNLNLGTKQTGESIGNVILPKWSSSAEDFIIKHRMALESEYVSEHLPDWIDLIFGYKQRGIAAEESFNCYNHLTYEGSIKLDELYEKDRPTFDRACSMIDNFGQTPCQLFTLPHPHRESNTTKVYNILPMISQNNYYCNRCCKCIGLYNLKIERIPMIMFKGQISQDAILFIGHNEQSNKIITIDPNRSIGLHSWKMNPKTLNMEFVQDVSMLQPATSTKVGYSYAINIHINDMSLLTQQLYAITSDISFLILYFFFEIYYFSLIFIVRIKVIYMWTLGFIIQNYIYCEWFINIQLCYS